MSVVLDSIAAGVVLVAAAAWTFGLARDAVTAIRIRARTHRIHLAEQPQFARLVEFAEAVDEQSAGDPQLQTLVADLRRDLAAMNAEASS